MNESIVSYQDFEKRYDFGHPETVLGEGGYGKVFLAYDTQRSRQVAVKISEVKGSGDKYSLLNETQLVKEEIPPHPNVVFYEHCYRFPVGRIIFDYAIMDYFPLGNLKQLLEKSTIDNAAKEDLALQILQGLQHLHTKANKGKGIIHRDIKPSNILVAQNPSTKKYTPKIGDFGISKSLKSEGGDTSNTFVGGSLYYAAPEQLGGEEQIRHNADLWSWGILSYQIFTQELPYTLTNLGEERTRNKRFYEYLEKATLPPLLHKIPEPYRTAVERCLIFDPKKRIQSAAELVMLLQFHESEIRTQLAKPERNPPDSIVLPPSVRTLTETSTGQPNYIKYSLIGAGLLTVVAVIFWLNSLSVRWFKGLGWISQPTDTTVVVSSISTVPSGTSNSTDPFADLMVYVEGGSFTMGCTSEQGVDCYYDEKPAKSTSVGSFYISKYEVTKAQWCAVMGVTLSELSLKSCAQCPIDMVTYDDIQVFLKKLNTQTRENYGLPTEVEWEYAARGGNNSQGYKYAGSNNLGDVAWYGGNSDAKIHVVGQRGANELGLYDMSGNVWEWTSSLYNGEASRVVRGGSWVNNPNLCRVSIRNHFNSDYRSHNNGFRVVRHL